MDALNNALATFSNFLWNDIALYVVLGTGVLFIGEGDSAIKDSEGPV